MNDQKIKQILEKDLVEIQQRIDNFAQARVQLQSKMLDLQKQHENNMRQMHTQFQEVEKEMASLQEDLKQRSAALGKDATPSTTKPVQQKGFTPYSDTKPKTNGNTPKKSKTARKR